MYVSAQSLLACLTLCNPMDCIPPGSSVHVILQVRRLEWVAIPSSRDLPDPGIEPESLTSPALAGGFFTTEPPGKPPLSLVNRISYQCFLIKELQSYTSVSI